MRPIIGNTPFRMRSWRGYLLIGLTIAEALVILALWGFLLLVFRGARPVQVSDLGLFLTLLAMTWTWWHFSQPLAAADEPTRSESVGSFASCMLWQSRQPCRPACFVSRPL